MNLMSNDTELIFEAHMWLHYLWAAPLFALTILVAVSLIIGPAALIGFSWMLLSVPLMAALASLVGKFKRRMLVFTDGRVAMIEQLLSGIQTIKIFAWEPPFLARIRGKRREEVGMLSWSLSLRSASRAFQFCNPAIVVFLTLMSYVLLGNKLSLEVSFMVMSFVK